MSLHYFVWFQSIVQERKDQERLSLFLPSVYHLNMSRTADAAVGMMDSAYFVGRQQLLSFFNDLLDLNLTKIEQTASGAVACQLTEYIFPNSVPMSRVNWEAKYVSRRSYSRK
jgi:hypothetical protein